jgi:hypothetical protein
MSRRTRQLRVVAALALAIGTAAGCRTLPTDTRSFDLGASVVGSARIQTRPASSEDAGTNATIPDRRYGTDVGWGVRTTLRTCVSNDDGSRCVELPVTYFPSTGLRPVSPAAPASRWAWTPLTRAAAASSSRCTRFWGPTPAIVTPGAGVMPADSTTDYFRAGAWLGYVVRLARR